MSALMFFAIASSASAQVDPCLPAERDPILAQTQLAVVEGARTATLALAAFKERIHPSVWPALWARDDPPPAEVRRALLVHGIGTELERSEAARMGAKAIYALLGDDAFEERALTLLDVHDNERASQEARWAMAHEAQTSCPLAYVRGKAARKLRRYRLAKSRLAEAVELCDQVDVDYEAKALLLSALVARILGERGTVVRAQEKLQTLTEPVHSYWDDALILEAELLESDAPDRAAATYEVIVDAGGDQAPKAAWRLARLAHDRGDVDAERSWLRRLSAQTLPAMERDRATWWLARTTTVAAQRHGMWTALVRRYGYHGRLALQALEAEAPDRAADLGAELITVATSTPAAPRFQKQPIFELARDYAVEAGPDASAAILHGWACAAPRSPALRLQAALLMMELGRPADAQLLVRPAQERLLANGLTPDSLLAWRTIYSRPYRAELEAAADAEALDPLLLTALAREESRFDPEVRSWAGAVGLTQLMPSTAVGAYASVFGGRLEDEARLHGPALNARLGAHVLAAGLRRYDSVPLALSAYNAGPGLTNGFLRRGPRDFPGFVESISVGQTRGYVRRVTESWLRYRLLYGASGARFPPLPREVPTAR